MGKVLTAQFAENIQFPVPELQKRPMKILEFESIEASFSLS